LVGDGSDDGTSGKADEEDDFVTVFACEFHDDRSSGNGLWMYGTLPFSAVLTYYWLLHTYKRATGWNVTGLIVFFQTTPKTPVFVAKQLLVSVVSQRTWLAAHPTPHVPCRVVSAGAYLPQPVAAIGNQGDSTCVVDLQCEFPLRFRPAANRSEVCAMLSGPAIMAQRIE
jgi:hypothetical protein